MEIRFFTVFFNVLIVLRLARGILPPSKNVFARFLSNKIFHIAISTNSSRRHYTPLSSLIAVRPLPHHPHPLNMNPLRRLRDGAMPVSLLPKRRYIEQRDPEIIALQRKNHLPRIPRPTDACPQPWTLEELLKWKGQWASQQRPMTQSEHDDCSECDRQILRAESDDGFELYDSEVERAAARREARQRPLSPPGTPPHLKGSKLYKHRQPALAPQTGTSRVGKTKLSNRVAPRRPCTRSQGTPPISLHDRKGQVKFWHLWCEYVIISYEQYLRDYVRVPPSRSKPSAD